MALLSQVNRASLLERVETALAEDHVPYTEAEFKLLRDIRKVRNAFGHGKLPPLPPANDLRLVISLVNRILVHRISRLWSNPEDTDSEFVATPSG